MSSKYMGVTWRGFIEGLAERDCTYGDGCPHFGKMNHGRCDSCKARDELVRIRPIDAALDALAAVVISHDSPSTMQMGEIALKRLCLYLGFEYPIIDMVVSNETQAVSQNETLSTLSGDSETLAKPVD